MMAIKAAYPSYYKNQGEIDDAVNIWAEMLAQDESINIAKAVKEYIKTNTSGFPPSIGQIRGLAKEINRKEWGQRQREIDVLPAPPIKAVPMPDDIREKMNKLMKGRSI